MQCRPRRPRRSVDGGEQLVQQGAEAASTNAMSEAPRSSSHRLSHGSEWC